MQKAHKRWKSITQRIAVLFLPFENVATHTHIHSSILLLILFSFTDCRGKIVWTKRLGHLQAMRLSEGNIGIQTSLDGLFCLVFRHKSIRKHSKGRDLLLLLVVVVDLGRKLTLSYNTHTSGCNDRTNKRTNGRTDGQPKKMSFIIELRHDFIVAIVLILYLIIIIESVGS